MKRAYLSLLAIPLVALAGLGILLIPRPATPAPRLEAPFVYNKLGPAPHIRLPDQNGRMTDLRTFAGRPVILTFEQATCTQLCPLVADEVRAAAANVRAGGGRVAVLAISADPEHDTHRAVMAFLRKHGGSSIWRYLVGTRKQLTPIWRAYGLYVAPANAPKALREAHISTTYLVDGQGRWRAEFSGVVDPATLARDVRILDGLPVSSSSRVEIAAQPGSLAPTFSLRSITGRTINLRRLRGHTVLVNVWATWCPPCRAEMPLLESTYLRRHSQGLQVVGIDREEAVDAVRTFAARVGVTYPLAVDASGTVTDRYIEGCTAETGIPVSFLVDASGTVAARRCGTLTAAWLNHHLDPLLRKPASS